MSLKLRDGIIIAICSIAVLVTGVVYSLFASNHIFNESKDHLEEIYEQVDTVFQQQMTGNSNVLFGMESYIDGMVKSVNGAGDGATAEHAELKNFFVKQRSVWGFSNFYFINSAAHTEDDISGDYKSVVSVKPVFDMVSEEYTDLNAVVDLSFRRDLGELLKKAASPDDDMHTVGVVGQEKGVDGKEFMLIAVSVKPNTLGGFTYDSIGLSFDSEDMRRLLAVQTFGAHGACFIMLPDGTVLVRSRADLSRKMPFFDYLASDKCDLDRQELDRIKDDWQKSKSATYLTEMEGEEYYLSYRPVGYSDWMLVGIAPSERVNRSMSLFRTVTIAVMAAILVLIVVTVTSMLIIINKRRVQETVLEVRSREDLLNLLSHDNRDVFIMFDPVTFTGNYVSSNVQKVLGLDLEQVKQDVRSVLGACVNKDIPAMLLEQLAALKTGGAWEKDLRLVNAGTGEVIWYHLALYRREGDGKEICVLTLSDRTAENNMRDSLEQALELAKNANAAKSNFLSNMSHDIRTPMNAIIGYATLLAKDADNPERVRDYTHKITYSGRHLLSLINDILDMSKIESGKTSLNTEPFNFPEFIEELYSIMAPQAHAKHQTFDIHTKGTMPECVVGDKLRLNQIMLNILSNAVKYTPDGGVINMRVEAIKQAVHGSAHLRFTVTDNGIGMSDDYVKTIFEPFSRADTEVVKNTQGTGLGMAITKNIVDLMGGTVTVQSELGSGSTFTVELELPVADPVDDDGDFWVRNNVTRVLVVDDEEDICMDIKGLMADTGVQVDYALNGKDAVKAVSRAVEQKQDYHIVLLDWKMPGMDGVQTARKIRAKVGRGVPIMVLTSYSFEDIEQEARDAGIDMFMSKPFFVSNFRRAVVQIRNDGAEADISPQPQSVSISGLKVLAAEDNEINAEILQELLEIEGVDCDLAQDGKQAYEKFIASDKGRYDIIFMDIQMPVMNGYEAARAIRASSHPDAETVPILAMTANAFDDDVKAALDAGMNAHLSKPIDMTKLKLTVSKIMEDKNK